MRERYRQEIEDILVGNVEKLDSKGCRARHGFWSRFTASRVWRVLTPGRVLGAALLLMLISFGWHSAASGIISSVLFWFGFGAFIAAYSMFFVLWGNKPEKRWRGRSVDDARCPNLVVRFRRGHRV